MNLEGANLEEACLEAADFWRTDLKNTKLIRASLTSANFQEADLSGARLGSANLDFANFRGANLEGANLTGASLRGAQLEGAIFDSAIFLETHLIRVDLSGANGLEKSIHKSASVVDHHTIAMSRNVPLEFWRGCGLPDALIDYMPSVIGDAIKFYSCFISYSSQDQEFADRLYADLQNAGVRCWFAPHDLEIGGVIQEDIDHQIRVRDKVILILSEASVASGWVTREVKTALAE